MTFDLEAAKKRCEEATPEDEWQATVVEGDHGLFYPTGPEATLVDDAAADRIFIAYARTDLPAAIAHIEWQEKMLERAKGSVTEAADMAYDEGNDRAEAECHAWLRDLEKGPPDELA